MKLLTIYTPAYNRREYLKPLYESLLAQTLQDFVWLVVDDGSDDGTEALMTELAAENRIEIRYIKKENGGKHTATNIAFECCDTELIMVALDSDDVLKEDAVSTIAEDYVSTGKKFSGYIYMKENTKGELFVKRFDSDLREMSWQEAVVGGHFDGEAVLILKSDYAKGFSYPVIEGERFFTEAYVYLQMTEPFWWSCKSIYVAEYLEDGYTKNIMRSFAGNPVSYAMFNDMRVKLYRTPLKRLKYAAYYCGFSMLSGRRGFVGTCSVPVAAFLAFPFGVAFFLMLKIKRSKRPEDA